MNTRCNYCRKDGEESSERKFSAFEIVRLQFSEFVDVDDDTLQMWIEICRPMVSKKLFCKLYEYALALFVCHKMKMANLGENPLGDMGKIGVGFGIGSVSEGGSSISWGAGQSSNLADDAEFGLTVYGLQYLQLRRTHIIPIMVSGHHIPYCH